MTEFLLMKASVSYVQNVKSNVCTKFGEYRRNFHLSKACHTLGGDTEPTKHA